MITSTDKPTREEVEKEILLVAAEYGLDPHLLLRQCAAESNFDQSAKSSCGALGLFQLLPATAAEMRIDPLKWKENVSGGAKYMAWLLKHYEGDYTHALAAYNYGVGRVDRLLHHGNDKWRESLPKETKDYLTRILGPHADSNA